MPTTVVTARTVSQVSVDVTREYRPNEARFWPRGAPAEYEMSDPAPTANGQNHRFMMRPKAYEARMPYPTSMSTSSRAALRCDRAVMRGSRPAPAATQPHAKIWKGVHGPMPPHSTDDREITSIPSRKPNRAPKARPARMSTMNTASRPPTPVPAIRTAAPTAVSIPSSTTVVALCI